MTQLPPTVLGIAFAAVVVAVTAIARRLPIPPPILQVAAGFLVGLVPGVSIPTLQPDLVFFVFLPPILWAAAFFTPARDFYRLRRPIGQLAVGLVLATSVAVAVAARALFPGMTWPVAVALGAIVSPPDAVAAIAIVSRLPVPRLAIVVLEGESLVNDASALILYRTAVAAAATGVFSLGEAIARFFLDAAVGIAIGVCVGWLIVRVLRWSGDAMAEIVVTLTAPYFAWLTAEAVHVSPVLACVAGGLYLRRNFSSAGAPLSRLQTRSVWDLVIFVLNAAIFLLLGAQFRALLAGVTRDMVGVLRAGFVIGVVAIAVRLVWVPIAAYLPRILSGRVRRSESAPTPKAVSLIAWTSMRGIVSLATALALPVTVAGGAPFPYRGEIIVIAMCVIMLTLVVQGLTLAPLIRLLAFTPENTHYAQARVARLEAARGGVKALDDLSREGWADARDVDRLRGALRDRVQLLEDDGGGPDGRRRLHAEVLGAARRVLVRLHNEGTISDDVRLELEQQLDLEAVRVGAGHKR
jgi:monovalent cation/hydrogen antiporter